MEKILEFIKKNWLFLATGIIIVLYLVYLNKPNDVQVEDTTLQKEYEEIEVLLEQLKKEEIELKNSQIKYATLVALAETKVKNAQLQANIKRLSYEQFKNAPIAVDADTSEFSKYYKLYTDLRNSRQTGSNNTP